MLSRLLSWLNGLPQLNMNSNPSAHMREVRFAYAGLADGAIGGLHTKRLPIDAGGHIRQLFTMGVMRLFAEIAFTDTGKNLLSDPPRSAWAAVRQIDRLIVSGGLRQVEADIFGSDADDYEGISINSRGEGIAQDMVEEIVNNRIRHSHVGGRFRRKKLG